MTDKYIKDILDFSKLNVYYNVGVITDEEDVYYYINPDKSCYDDFKSKGEDSLIAFALKCEKSQIINDKTIHYIYEDQIILLKQPYLNIGNVFCDFYRIYHEDFLHNFNILELDEYNLDNLYNTYLDLYQNSRPEDEYYEYYYRMYNLYDICYNNFF